MASQITNIRMPDPDRARMIRLADARYGGNRSDAIRAALAVLDVVLAAPATATVDPGNAGALLDAWRRVAGDAH